MYSSTRSCSKRPRKPHNVQIVLPGEITADEQGAMRGHGTYLEDKKLIASVSGIVDRIGKLVSVRPLKSRYTGELGDVVIGRIIGLSSDRWTLDINARQHATLLLGSINLPGGIHRRRTIDDALQMRNYFVEHDVIVADVQTTYQDGSISLQVPRLLGKLGNGTLVTVPHTLIKRVKTHFCELPCEVEVILGNNGYIWVTPTLSEEEKENREQQGDHPSMISKPVSVELRQKIARVRNSIVVLAQLFLPIHPDYIMEVYNASLKYHAKDMLREEVIDRITQKVWEMTS